MKTGTCAPALIGALFALLSPLRAHAQASDAAATALFDEGRKLMTQHHYAEACPKLAESQRLAPSGGTLLNLAECYEHSGQTASAWVAWKDTAARANAAGKVDMEKKALARAAALEAGLARLTIAVVAESDVAGLEVKRDGVLVGRAEYGTAIPVDPGPHVIEASAPKKMAWTKSVDVAAKQSDARVTVTLADDGSASAPQPIAPTAPVPAPAAAPAPEPPPSSAGGAQRTTGIVAVGAGVAGVAVGAIFGIVAISKNNEALQPQNCPTSRLCTKAGLSLTADANDAATVSTIAFGVGAAAIVGGALLWLTAPTTPATEAAVRVVPVVGVSYAGVSIARAW
jgi:hypothetical protein